MERFSQPLLELSRHIVVAHIGEQEGRLLLVENGDPALAAGAFDEPWRKLCGPNGQLANLFED